MMKKGKFQHSSRHKDSIFKKKNQEENNEIICFECRKPGLMKAKCPQQKKRRYSRGKKKKSLMITWDDLDSEKSDSLDDEQANICLMIDTNDELPFSRSIQFQPVASHADVVREKRGTKTILANGQLRDLIIFLMGKSQLKGRTSFSFR